MPRHIDQQQPQSQTTRPQRSGASAEREQSQAQAKQQPQPAGRRDQAGSIRPQPPARPQRQPQRRLRAYRSGIGTKHSQPDRARNDSSGGRRAGGADQPQPARRRGYGATGANTAHNREQQQPPLSARRPGADQGRKAKQQGQKLKRSFL